MVAHLLCEVNEVSAAYCIYRHPTTTALGLRNCMHVPGWNTELVAHILIGSANFNPIAGSKAWGG